MDFKKILKFIYKKDSSSDAGIDAIEIRNFRFKRCSVFKYDDGYYVPSNIGLQNSESVMVLHPGLSNQTWDYHEYSNNYISGYYYVDIQMAHELIHDWFEIYDQWGDVVYSTKDKTVGSDTFSYYFN